MADMLKSSREEDYRRQTEAQFYSLQQQLDELRRQLKENLARQQWFEELYKQNEGKVAQVQTAHDRLMQDISQTLAARQIDDARTKQQLAEVAGRIESPDKQFREIRAQIQEINDGRKADRDTDAASQRKFDEVQGQIREVHALIGKVSDSQRQLRDIIQELDSAIGEVRQEALHLAELQTMEEQRLRRQGVELQGLFETLRQQFTEVSARSQRVDDVRRQLTERIEATEERLTHVQGDATSIHNDLDRIEKQLNEQYITQQERLETVRLQLDTQLGEVRQIGDQRMDRIMTRFTGLDDRLRAIEQMLSEMPSRFEALERRDEALGTEADTIEEWLVIRQLAAMESVLEDVRKRRAERASTFNPKGKNGTTHNEEQPGSVYNPAGLIKSVRDAKPPQKTEE